MNREPTSLSPSVVILAVLLIGIAAFGWCAGVLLA